MYRTIFSTNSFTASKFGLGKSVGVGAADVGVAGFGSAGLGIFTGISMILFGVLILIEPRLLAAMVACFFFFAGAFVLMVSLAMRSQIRPVRDIDARDIDSIVTR